MLPYEEMKEGMAKRSPISGRTNARAVTIIVPKKYLRVFSADT